jgi:hypothetical protein
MSPPRVLPACTSFIQFSHFSLLSRQLSVGSDKLPHVSLSDTSLAMVDLFGLGGYGDGEHSTSGDTARPKATIAANSGGDDDETSSSSIDSEEERALVAQARLQDFGAEVAMREKAFEAAGGASVLPTVTDAFDEVIACHCKPCMGCGPAGPWPD